MTNVFRGKFFRTFTISKVYNSKSIRIAGDEVMGKLIIEGNSVYEIDEACIQRKERQERKEQDRREAPERRQYPKRKQKGI